MISVRVRTKVWLEREGQFVVGDGGLRLLHGITRHGSLTAAVRDIGWSYRHAWAYLRRAEAALGAPLTRARPGKGTARGTTLTPQGRLVLKALVAARRRVDLTVGPSGPTTREIAARGAPARRASGNARRPRQMLVQGATFPSA
jgi:molybdate transport system regulatory protein